MTRTGKIARLPLHIREQLNARLQDGEQGKKLVVWLNSLPEVRRLIADEFSGRPVREQNLSEWKQGGYRDWLLLREAEAAVARLEEESSLASVPDGPPLSDTLARWLAVRYAAATRQLADSEGPVQWRLLREMCGDIAELRRGDHSAQRLEIERERLAAAQRDADMKWKRKVVIGLETLVKQLPGNPQAQAAFDQLAGILQHPFDPTESDQIRPPE